MTPEHMQFLNAAAMNDLVILVEMHRHGKTAEMIKVIDNSPPDAINLILCKAIGLLGVSVDQMQLAHVEDPFAGVEDPFEEARKAMEAEAAAEAAKAAEATDDKEASDGEGSV